ncbi:4-hydroxy-tetrahydrodipicolinate synthase [Bradyrhizobium sp. Leo170]|uniref:4-hydroxy-tetrahydrodipicolinate synthase n=1 Tax=Bradyrhizobium sp. Leo170 TaxID=1571199 RepID=UPI00102E39A6|nr:4-hydroxy-tetrahydrodipicolinate synthase [Bradyrhizobium sp. Leo170]TAI65730.1 4-hydroxy-tetrahydrodipicolinate synthase [Bradyrhizobium sp. Leo170]
MKPDWLTGYVPDLPTPFDEDGEVDFDAFARLCERQIASGASAIVVGETTGEAPTLATGEKAGLVRRAVEVAHGRVRVIAGAGSNATDRAVELTRQAEAAGADAVLSVVPYYNKPMQAGIFVHFRAVAEATALPVILHDTPSRTLRELSDATLKRLAESEQFIGLRDSSGDVGRLVRIRTSLPPHFRLLSGDDLTALPFMAAGGHGCISAVANLVPELCQAVLASLREGRPQSARYLFSRLVPIAGLLAAEHPAALKYALSLLGLIRPSTRLPIVQLNDAARTEVAKAIADLGDEEWSGVEDTLPAAPARHQRTKRS